jgi:hypothetical protein
MSVLLVGARWSSGQDRRLSTGGQGFDSPTGYWARRYTRWFACTISNVRPRLRRGCGVTAAHATFNRGGVGSTPTGPTNNGTKVLAAAPSALNRKGEGSSPSGPTDDAPMM